MNWIQSLVSKYNIDGLRIDTIPEVPKWFWKMFSASAGVFTIGEIFDGRLGYVSDYQNYIDATLNYPLYFSIRDVFGQEKSMTEFESRFKDINSYFKDPSVLGVFVNNHDNARFLNSQNNQQRFKSAIAFSLFTSKNFKLIKVGFQLFTMEMSKCSVEEMILITESLCGKIWIHSKLFFFKFKITFIFINWSTYTFKAK